MIKSSPHSGKGDYTAWPVPISASIYLEAISSGHECRHLLEGGREVVLE